MKFIILKIFTILFCILSTALIAQKSVLKQKNSRNKIRTATEQTSSYDMWKQEKESQWKELKMSAIDQVIELVELVQYNFEKLTENNYKSFLAEHQKEQALFAYNLLREKSNTSAAKTFNDIDKEWFENIKQTNKVYLEAEGSDLLLPNISQQELLLEAQKITGIQKKLAFFSSEEGAHCSEGYIAASEMAKDLNEMLAQIYHELGHINHKDSQRSINLDKKSFIQDKSQNHTSNPYITFINTNKELKQDQIYIKKYIDLAHQKLNKSSKTGEKILEELSKTKTLWEQPNDPEIRAEMTIGRWEESMADLFSFKQLIKQKNIEPILYVIHYFGTSGYNTVTKDDDDPHPSSLERSLIAIGFLISNGVDVNNALKQWEKFGICKDIHKLYGPESRLHKKELSTFEQEYMKLVQKNEWLNYELFKNEELKRINTNIRKLSEEFKKPSADENSPVNIFIGSAIERLEDYKESPLARRTKAYALYSYNLLREVNHLPIANNIKELDEQWLLNLNKKMFNEPFIEKQLSIFEKKHSDQTLYQKIEILIHDFEDAISDQSDKTALHVYNLIRKLLWKPIIISFDQIDKKWLKDIQYEYWKKDFENYGQDSKAQVSKEEKIEKLLLDITKDLPNSDISKTILFKYNYTRELLKLPTVTSVNDIDKMWLQEQLKQKIHSESNQRR